MAELESQPLSAEERAELEELRAEKARREAQEEARREREELAALRAEREKLSELTRPVTLYPQQLDNVRVTDKDAAMDSAEVKAAVEKAEKYLEGNGRVLVRASGTEPLVRVLAEAPDERLCANANAIVLAALEPFKA